MTNNLFVSNETYILLFPNFEYALKVFRKFARDGGVNMEQDELEGIQTAIRCIEVNNFEPNLEIYYSSPKDPILLVEKKTAPIKMFQDEFYSDIEFWYVITGEKIGWMVAYEGIKLEPLRLKNDR
jgi:hypothetical protein